MRLRRTVHMLGLAAVALSLLYCAASHKLLFLSVAPSSASLSAADQTIQFRAEGTDVRVSEASPPPATTDWTHRVTWSSSNPAVATITLTSCSAGTPGCTVVSNLPALNVYVVGQGTGTVTSSPAGINCNPSSGSVSGCTGYFPSGTAVQLTASPTGFGGWSANCTPSTSAMCTVTMNINQTVGAIFN